MANAKRNFLNSTKREGFVMSADNIEEIRLVVELKDKFIIIFNYCNGLYGVSEFIKKIGDFQGDYEFTGTLTECCEYVSENY